MAGMQVIFSSRTHSQLSQTIAELQRTGFADSVSTVSLGSRKVGFGLLKPQQAVPYDVDLCPGQNLIVYVL